MDKSVVGLLDRFFLQLHTFCTPLDHVTVTMLGPWPSWRGRIYDNSLQAAKWPAVCNVTFCLHFFVHLKVLSAPPGFRSTWTDRKTSRKSMLGKNCQKHLIFSHCDQSLVRFNVLPQVDTRSSPVLALVYHWVGMTKAQELRKNTEESVLTEILLRHVSLGPLCLTEKRTVPNR